MDSTTDGKGIDTATLIATASNDWKQDPLPEVRKDGERRILWPVRGNESEESPFGGGGLW